MKNHHSGYVAFGATFALLLLITGLSTQSTIASASSFKSFQDQSQVNRVFQRGKILRIRDALPAYDLPDAVTTPDVDPSQSAACGVAKDIVGSLSVSVTLTSATKAQKADMQDQMDGLLAKYCS